VLVTFLINMSSFYRLHNIVNIYLKSYGHYISHFWAFLAKPENDYSAELQPYTGLAIWPKWLKNACFWG
ncbi:MAG: hypothetical protein PHR27_01455, partial [Candidatus Cloacimonetes bacterium]|nr:hypothetical protein [Candidatus Cloacimonadota bacterium]